MQVLDILDYSELIGDNGFILFLDFYKTFDTVENKQGTGNFY